MIVWRAWSGEAFETAAKCRAPLLLLIARSGDKAAFERAFEGLDDLAERFVTVAVEDRDRPDVSLRYAGRGEVLLLDHDGRVLDAAALSALAEKLRGWLERFEALQKPKEEPPRAPGWTGAVGGPGRLALAAERPREALRAVLAARRLPVAAVELLLYAGAEWGDASARSRAETELADLARSLLKGELGLYEAAWSARLMWDAFAALGDPKTRERAAECTSWLLRERFDPERRAFRHAAAVGAPVYADENALAAMALQRASVFEPSARYGQTADDVLAFLRGCAYDPLLGMIHRRRDDNAIVYGLLSDAAWTILAFTEAFQLTAHKPHRDFADNLARFLFQELWDRDGGGFLDRVPQRDDSGLLREPRLARPEDNAAALEGLWRLHHLKGNMNYRRWLEWALARLAGESGLAGAGFARVQDMLQRGRLYLELIGRPGDDGRADLLLSAALRHYSPRRVISFVDPDDQDYILAHKLEAPSYPRLFGCVELRPVASAGSADEVAGVIKALS